jgi:EmrB/QacA subfamily drug resistance transporter
MAVTIGVMTGIFLAALESTVVGTAMPTVIASLGGLSLYSWVFSVYLLTSTVTVPLWGRLSDIYGRRPLYMAGIALFLVGSALSGLSRSMVELIIFRAIQGAGAGALLPLAMTIIGDIYSLEERAKMQGLFSSVWGASSIVGPIIGGFITDHLSWRWVFYVNIPFGLVAAVVIGLALIEPREHSKRVSIDYAGAASLVAAMTLLLLVLMQGGKGSGWSSGPTLGMLAAFALLMLLFVYIERRAAEPVLSFSLFSNRAFSVTAVNGFFVGMAMFSTISFIPLFVQGVIGTNATQAGSALTPFMLGWVIFSTVSGRLLLKTGYRPTVFGGMVCLVVGFFLLTRMGISTSRPLVLLNMAILGAGMGLSVVALLIAVQNSVPRRQLGVVTSATVFFRSIGGAVGTAIMGSVMSSQMFSRTSKLLDPSSMGDSTALLREIVRNPGAIIDPASRAGIPQTIRGPLTEALAGSLHTVFLVGFTVALLAFISAFFVPGGKARVYSDASQQKGVDHREERQLKASKP